MMPFVKLPVAGDDIGNGALEGGVILPLLLRLPADWEIETDIELFSDVSNEFHAGWVATFDCGVSVACAFPSWPGMTQESFVLRQTPEE